MPTAAKTSYGAPQKHHLDRRADALAEAGAGNGDDLLTTEQVAEWLGVSRGWLEIGRGQGYGPKFVALSPRNIRYRRAAVRAWLRERTHACTREYDTGRRRRAG